MKKSRLFCGLVVCVLSIGTITLAHSATVNMDYVFGDASLSGGFSYDDTSSTPLSGQLAGFTAFTPVSLDVTYSSGVTTYSWNLSDYATTISGFTFLPTIDQFGVWATSSINKSTSLWTSASFENEQGALLIFSDEICGSMTPSSWCTRNAIVKSPPGESLVNSTYETSPSTVPIPAAILLFGSGLLGLIGISWRKQAS